MIEEMYKSIGLDNEDIKNLLEDFRKKKYIHSEEIDSTEEDNEIEELEEYFENLGVN